MILLRRTRIHACFPSLVIRVCTLGGIIELGLLLAVAIVFLLSYLGYGKIQPWIREIQPQIREFYDKQIILWHDLNNY